MFCPSDANSGLIQLVGPIASQDITSMTQPLPPLSIRFGPRSTPPTITSGYRIEEDPSANTCKYGTTQCSLVDVQISKPVHTGYNLPGNTDTPVAELILSFKTDSEPSSRNDISGVLMCLPIFESGSPSHSEYLTQIFEQDATKPNTASLESLFYSSDTDASQTSFGYRTCFETQSSEGHIGSYSLFVNIYPHGIQLSSASQRIRSSSLSTYQLPPGLRGGDATVRSYTVDDNGEKVVTRINSNGELYTTPLSSCSDSFKNGRFEYFTSPPRRIGLKFSQKTATANTCPTIGQYKCMPFDQLRDENGNYAKVEDGTCLKDIINTTPSTNPSNSSNTSYSTAEIEGIVGGVLGGTLLLLGIVFAVSKLSKS